MQIGRQIKQHRARLGLSQEELAASIFVSRQTVSNWETDKTYPDIQSLLLLSERFDVSVDDLMREDVAAMQEIIENDWKKMSRLCALGWGLTLAGVAAFALLAGEGAVSGIVPGVREGTLLGGVLFLGGWAAGFVGLHLVERYTKKNDLVTYRDLVAYSKGEAPVRDASAFDRRHPTASKLLMAAAAAVIGFALALLAMAALNALGL